MYVFSVCLFLFQTLDGKVHFVYKKVAMVEQFFDIIYSVHVEAATGDGTQLRGRAGKHCGQKRTYRAVSRVSYSRRRRTSSFLRGLSNLAATGWQKELVG